ncbi:MAG TPA: hypothetical protein VND43_04695 [Burkholderiales bacterium]|nr:hypothetical protein [Pseudomonadota bacterium]HVC49448.1 hypothetical protein [Burkholderiales bacterium]
MAPDLKLRLHIKLTLATICLALVSAVALPVQANMNEKYGLLSPVSDASLKQISGRGISINISNEPNRPVVLLWDEMGNANSSSGQMQMDKGVNNTQTQTLILTQPGAAQ